MVFLVSITHSLFGISFTVKEIVSLLAFFKETKMVINLSKITTSWDKDLNGWSIAPAGISWVKEGYRIRVGDKCIIGDGCTLGNGCKLGNGCTLGWCTLGDGCTLGNGCRIEDGCRLGNGCTLGNGCRIGEGHRLGEECTLGANATDPIDLGFVDGYRRCIANVDGVAYIGAGCRWFTLQDAIKHWERREDRALTRVLMEYAKAIANHKGWKHN